MAYVNPNNTFGANNTYGAIYNSNVYSTTGPKPLEYVYVLVTDQELVSSSNPSTVQFTADIRDWVIAKMAHQAGVSTSEIEIVSTYRDPMMNATKFTGVVNRPDLTAYTYISSSSSTAKPWTANWNVKFNTPVRVWAEAGEEIPEEPDEKLWSPERVVAFRRWKADTSYDVTLIGGYGMSWLPGKDVSADCTSGRKQEGPPPHWDCNCGIYAAKNRDILGDIGWYNNYSVSGTVELYGKVIEHELGYRAQYAHIRDLRVEVPGPHGAALAENLRVAYGVPVTQKTEVDKRWRE